MNVSKKDFKKVCEMQIKMEVAYCYLCGKPILNVRDYNIDHVVPRSRGGIDAPSNWRPVHRKCNEEKGSLTFEEYKLFLELKAKRDGHVK